MKSTLVLLLAGVCCATTKQAQPWKATNTDPVAIHASLCTDSSQQAFKRAVQESLTKNNRFSVHQLIANGKKYGVLLEVLDYVQYWKRQDIGMLEE